MPASRRADPIRSITGSRRAHRGVCRHDGRVWWATQAPARMEIPGPHPPAPIARPPLVSGRVGHHVPTNKGRGLGGKVLAPMLERCDRTATVAYLESSNPANIAFYRRHGFETTGELVLGRRPSWSP